MIRRIEVRVLGDERHYFEHVKLSIRHVKMLCGLRLSNATLLIHASQAPGYSRWRACQICKAHPAAIDHQFAADWEDVEY